MDGRCERHQFEAAINRCDHCGGEFCSECLLFPFGEKKPPFCIPCTISQSGLRSGGAKVKKTKLSRKERKELAASGPVDAPAPIVSASAQAMMSASKRTVRVAEDPVEAKPGKRGRLGRRKGAAEEEPSAPTPVAASTPIAPAAPPSEAPPAADEDRSVPEGAGMTAPGAETIDWSKPFEVSS